MSGKPVIRYRLASALTSLVCALCAVTGVNPNANALWCVGAVVAGVCAARPLVREGV